MNNTVQKVLALILVVMLLSADVASIAEAVLILPESIRIIEEEAFYGDTSAEIVIVPEGAREIHSRAFASSSISEIELPESLEYIADDAFDGASGISVTAPEGSYAYEWADIHDLLAPPGEASPAEDFEYTINSDRTASITGYIGSGGNVIMPKSIDGYVISRIDDRAFYKCTSLTSIYIPNGVTSIGDGVFSDCDSLSHITLPDSVTSIGDRAFSYCYNLTSITLPNSITSIGDFAFYSCTSLTNLYIPDSVTSIGVNAFSGCSSLMCIYISDSVTSIGNFAFTGCSSLTNIYIPDSVISIGVDAFSYCYSLTSINIPGSITSIGNGAFSSCYALTSINIPDSVTSISNFAFYRCTSLKNIYIPDTVTSIGEYAFAECTSLTNIYIPDTVTSIGEFAFWRCKSFTNINIPDSVTSIGYSAFLECTSLTSIYVPGSVTSIGNGAFSSCSSNLVIYGKPASQAETYAKKNRIKFIAKNSPDSEEDAKTYDISILKVLAQGYTPGPLLILNNDVANKMNNVNAYNFFSDHPIRAIVLSTGETLMIPSASASLNDGYRKYYEEAALVTLYYLSNGHLTESNQLIRELEEAKDKVDKVEFAMNMAECIKLCNNDTLTVESLFAKGGLTEFASNLSPALMKSLDKVFFTIDKDSWEKYFNIEVESDWINVGDALLNNADTILDAIIVSLYRDAIITQIGDDMINLLLTGGNDEAYNEIFRIVLSDIESQHKYTTELGLAIATDITDAAINSPIINMSMRKSSDIINGNINDWYDVAVVYPVELVSDFMAEVWLPAKALNLGFELGTSYVDAFLFDTDEIGKQMRNFSLSYITASNARTQLINIIANMPDVVTEKELKELYNAYVLYYNTTSSAISVGFKLIATIHSKNFSSYFNGGKETCTLWLQNLSESRELLSRNYISVLDWFVDNCPSALR